MDVALYGAVCLISEHDQILVDLIGRRHRTLSRNGICVRVNAHKQLFYHVAANPRRFVTKSVALPLQNGEQQKRRETS